MYCWNCGSENEDGARFCWNCGSDLQAGDEQVFEDLYEPEEEKKGGKPVLIIVIVCILICLVIGGGGGLYWYMTRDTDVSESSSEKDEREEKDSSKKDEEDSSKKDAKEKEDEEEDKDDKDKAAANAQAEADVEQIIAEWNESCSFILEPDCVKYTDGGRTEYYDQNGKAVRFTQSQGGETVTYLFNDNEEVIYVTAEDSSSAYTYYYYKDGKLICFSKNAQKYYEPFDAGVSDDSARYVQNAKTLLADRLSNKQQVSGSTEGTSNQDYILPDSSSRILSAGEVSGLTKEELRLARNEIFARHGRRFDDAGLQSYFDSKPWYSGTIDPDDFTESMLSEIEKKNIELIKKYE